MGLAIAGAVLTLAGVVAAIVGVPQGAGEDARTARDAWILLAGAMLAMETAVFFVGRALRRSVPSEAAQQQRPRRRRWLLVPYLLGTLGIGALVAFMPREAWKGIEPLGLLVCQPQILVQIIGGGLLGIKLRGDEAQHIVTIAANLLYFPILLYPLYRILSMDRKTEARAYALMRIVLALFLGAHILIALFLLVISQA